MKLYGWYSLINYKRNNPDYMGYNEMGEEILCNLVQLNKIHPGLDYVYCGELVSYQPYSS
jgi:hypothetical protein